jgi:hypothetical protein
VFVVIPPLLSHTRRKGTRAGSREKLIPITYCFSHYMELVCGVSRGKTGEADTEKRAYRNSGGGDADIRSSVTDERMIRNSCL